MVVVLSHIIYAAEYVGIGGLRLTHTGPDGGATPLAIIETVLTFSIPRVFSSTNSLQVWKFSLRQGWRVTMFWPTPGHWPEAR